MYLGSVCVAVLFSISKDVRIPSNSDLCDPIAAEIGYVDHQNESESEDPRHKALPDYRMHLSSHRCLEIRLLRKKQNGRLNYRK